MIGIVVNLKNITKRKKMEAALMVTFLLEFLQLWHPAFLQVLRSSFIGSTILGTTFVWSDFPYYFAGSAMGWLWIKGLQRK